MRCVVVSAFRNAAGQQINRWMDQILSLRRALRQKHFCYLRVVAVEGDSKDATRAQLETLADKQKGLFELDIVTCNVGGPHYGSIEHPDRMKNLSVVGNAMLSSVRDNDDIVVYVESDLIWSGETVSTLIDHVMANETDVAAPMIFAGENFYDIYCFRGLDNERFTPFVPYHPSLKSLGLTHVSSAGSCLVMRGEVARKVRIPGDDVLIGFCRAAREQNYTISVASQLSIRHPV